MTLHTNICLTAVLSACLAACNVDEAALDPGASGPARAALNGFEIDSTALQQRPTGGLPAPRLTAQAFGLTQIATSLIQTTETFQDTGMAGSRRFLESPTWFLEVDDRQGSVLVLRKVPGGSPSPQDESQLLGGALARLQAWGIGQGEMGPALQRRLMKQDHDDGGAPTQPFLLRYKTFVRQAINGVPVEGHRAVVTHHLDGSFHRAYISWPPLSAGGHLLHSQMSIPDIEARATAALNAAGETAGQVKLYWKYVPVLQPSGEATLVLKVSARLAAETQPDVTEEPRIIDVDVDPGP